jgi:nucleoside 2-deoxyribosyltransferase
MTAFTIYAAGGLFTQDELAMNVFLKEALWRLSGGRYRLILPQSKGPSEEDPEDLALAIRNLDLLHVMQSDLLLARFEGQEPDAGAVAEFMWAMWLGKPAVILRSDSRRLEGQGLDDPYNLMVRNWRRAVAVHVNAFTGYLDRYLSALGEDSADDGAVLAAEQAAVRAGVEGLARAVMDGLDRARALPSPYPEAERERVYELARLAPGGGFEDLLPPEKLAGILRHLREQGTL